MALTRKQKEKIVLELKDKISRQKGIIFVGFKGLKVKELSELREKLKEINSELKIAKKTLLKIALRDLELNLEPKKLMGEVGLVLGYQDEISPAKLVYQFSKKHQKLEILGGIINRRFLEAERMIELARLPSKEELFGKLIGTLSAPIYNLVNVLKGNIKGLLYLLTEKAKG